MSCFTWCAPVHTRIVMLVFVVVILSGCAGDMMGDEWQAANAEQKRAQAAAEWARTHQVEAEARAVAAEAAARADEAVVRAQAQTAAIVGSIVVGVLTLAGLGGALVYWAWRRAHLVYTDKAGLYPVVIGASPVTNLNEPGAQHARIAPGRAPVQVLPAPENDPIELIPEPVIIDGRRLEHIERLLLAAPAGSNYDSTD